MTSQTRRELIPANIRRIVNGTAIACRVRAAPEPIGGSFVKVTVIPLAAALAASLLWAGRSDAQVRVGGGVRVATPRTRVSVVVGRPYYYRPFYYRSYYRPYYPYYFAPFYGSYFYGSYFYRPFYWYPYAQAGYGYGGFDGASLRVQVTPRDTEVFIDNYYAGTADDFDGLFQRLHVEPGAHDITLYREGYRTIRQRIYIQPTGTFRLRYMMVPLGPGEIAEPRPAEPPRPPNAPGPPGGAPSPQGAYPPPRSGYPPPGNRSESASLSIRVQPANAEVFIDGEAWQGAAGDERLVVQVAPGVHHVEARREGYRTYQSDITVRPGETSTVNISLSRQ
jgi:PEGA domain-containing protein